MKNKKFQNTEAFVLHKDNPDNTPFAIEMIEDMIWTEDGYIHSHLEEVSPKHSELLPETSFLRRSLSQIELSSSVNEPPDLEDIFRESRAARRQSGKSFHKSISIIDESCVDRTAAWADYELMPDHSTHTSMSIDESQFEFIQSELPSRPMDFQQCLVTDLAQFQLCEYLIEELEAIHFSSILDADLRRAENIFIESENFEELTTTLYQEADNSSINRSISSIHQFLPSRTLQKLGNRFRPRNASSEVDSRTDHNRLLAPRISSPQKGSSRGSLQFESHQAALIAAGVLRIVAADSLSCVSRLLRFQKLQETVSTFTDLDWVKAQVNATFGRLFPSEHLSGTLSQDSILRTDLYSLHDPCSLASSSSIISSSGGTLLTAKQLSDGRDSPTYNFCSATSIGGQKSSQRAPSEAVHSRMAQTQRPPQSLLTLRGGAQTPVASRTGRPTLTTSLWSIGVENFFFTSSLYCPPCLPALRGLQAKRLITTQPLPKSKRASILRSQRNCCAGCGTSVEKKYLRSLRFCEYYGQFFCCVCHSNTLMVLPGAVMKLWSFVMLPVSNFARDVLVRLHNQPLLHLSDFAPTVLQKQSLLKDTIELRKQASLMMPFINLCQEGCQSLVRAENLPSHWVTSADSWSLADLCSVADGKMSARLRNALEVCVAHLLRCIRCKSRGFLCETCHTGRILFPFGQVNTVACPKCGACFHRACLPNPSPDTCSRCLRRLRRSQLPPIDLSPNDSPPTEIQQHPTS